MRVRVRILRNPEKKTIATCSSISNLMASIVTQHIACVPSSESGDGLGWRGARRRPAQFSEFIKLQAERIKIFIKRFRSTDRKMDAADGARERECYHRVSEIPEFTTSLRNRFRLSDAAALMASELEMKYLGFIGFTMPCKTFYDWVINQSLNALGLDFNTQQKGPFDDSTVNEVEKHKRSNDASATTSIFRC